MNFLSGFSSGLLNSFYCAGVCLPIVFPFAILKSAEDRWQFYSGLLTFLFGRLLGYLLIAVMTGFAGQIFNRISAWPKISAAIQILLALIIIQSVFNRRIISRIKLSGPFNYSNSLFFIGLALGVNICPPFILAINQSLLLAGVFPAISYFLGFFTGSSVWVVILVLAPALARIKRLSSVLNIFLLLMGLYYLLTGLVHLFQ